MEKIYKKSVIFFILIFFNLNEIVKISINTLSLNIYRKMLYVEFKFK